MNRQFPIGRFEAPTHTTAADREAWTRDIEQLPVLLRQAVEELSPEGLDQPYREGGWTARQVVHHVADSHINSYVRFRLALTESKPVVKPYEEAAWADLVDARSAEVEVSLRLIESLHERWAMLLRSLSDEQWERVFIHPKAGEMNLAITAALYSWHGRHHVAHIQLIATEA